MEHPRFKPFTRPGSSAMEVTLGCPYSSPRSLVTSLITLAQNLESQDAVRIFQKRSAATIRRKFRILSMLFQEINETESPLPPSALLCLRELSITMQRIKLCFEDSAQSSCLWQLLKIESTSLRFRELTEDIANALEILPVRLLNVSEEVIEQVQLVYAQMRRANSFLDPIGEQLRAEILSLLDDFEKHIKPDRLKLGSIIESLRLNNAADCQQEMRLLEAEISNQAGTGGITVLSTIRNLIAFVRYCREQFFVVESEDFCRISSVYHSGHVMFYSGEVSTSESEQNFPSSTPDEFRCPISLDLMMDPVIVATGHTYDRAPIAKWLESGHLTCPKSGQKLLHVSLIPNYALRSVISQWCEQHSIPYEKHENTKGDSVDHTESTRAALEATRTTAAFLVGKLATGSPEIQKQVAYELRLLAKCGMENRMCIAEAGAIPFLVPLLHSKDHRTQENAVTALLNLSIYENNKILIMASGALDPIIEVLRSGATMESRENAAATLFSLSVVDENKVVIGSRPEAIPALVNLLREGSARGKKDAATALFNLSLYVGNKPKVVAAGAIPLLVHLLKDERAGITDDALAVLAVLAASAKGLIAISETEAIPVLVDLLRLGSNKGKENSISVLLALCRSGGEDVMACVLQTAMPSLQDLVSVGSPRAQRKAASLLKLLNRYGPLNHTITRISEGY